MAGIGREEYSRDLLMVSVSPLLGDRLIFFRSVRASWLGLTATKMEYAYPKHSYKR